MIDPSTRTLLLCIAAGWAVMCLGLLALQLG